MSNIQKNINKVSRALRAKGMMPLINISQFYGENGPVTKYIVHYGNANEFSKKNDIVATTCSKAELLKTLVSILKAGDADG